MELRQDNVQTSRPACFISQFDIGSTSSHVGGDRDPARLARRAYDLSLIGILPRIEYNMFYATCGKFTRDAFGCFNASSAD